MKSILQSEKECWFCHKQTGLHEHHLIPGTANREMSERFGLKVYVCPEHHQRIHSDPEIMLAMRKIGQSAFEVHSGRELFIEFFGKSYL